LIVSRTWKVVRVVAVVVLAGMIGSDAIRADRFDLGRERDLMLVYVGAEDCPPCRVWQRDEAPVFRSAPEFQRIAYREIKSPKLFDLLNDDYWPDDLRGYRDQLGRGAGAPMWLVILDRKIVGRGSGASQWQSAIVPTLKALSRQSPSGPG
jgi:hypothetical protein